MDETQVDALQKQVEHWQHKFRDEEHHNRELQLQLDTAMADRSKLSHDLRVKTILMEDMSKELEELTITLSTCTCKTRQRGLQEELVARQEDACTGDVSAPRVITGRDESQFVLRMLIVERHLQWMLHKDIEDHKKLLEDQKSRIEDLQAQVVALTTIRDQLTADVTKETQLRHDTEEVVGRLNTRMKELCKDLHEKTDQLGEKTKQHQKLQEDIASLHGKQQKLEDQISASNLSMQTICKDAQTKDTKLQENADRIKQLEQRLKQTDKTKESLAARGKDIETKLERTKTESATLETKLKEAEETRQSLEDLSKEIGLKLEQTNVDNAVLSEKIQTLEREIEEKEKQRKKLKCCLESTEIEEGQLEGEVKIISNEMTDALKTHVLELVKEKAKQYKEMFRIGQAVSSALNAQYTNYWHCTIGYNYVSSVWKTKGKSIVFGVNGLKVDVYHRSSRRTVVKK